MIATDTHSVIGANHISAGLTLQDYAETRRVGAFWQMALSDGCSSGGRTDFGSRLMVRLVLKHHQVNESFFGDLQSLSSQLTLDTEDLLATLLYAEGYGSKIRKILIFGDGELYLERGKDSFLFQILFPQNMPWYPVYLLEEKLKDKYLKLQKDKSVRVRCFKNFQVTEEVFVPMESVVNEGVKISLPEGVFEKVFLFSDGVESLALAPEKVVKSLIQIPNSNGNFMVRRLNKQIKRWSKEGYVFQDDVSVAGLIVQTEGGPNENQF